MTIAARVLLMPRLEESLVHDGGGAVDNGQVSQALSNMIECSRKELHVVTPFQMN